MVFFHFQYAKSDNSSCQECKTLIEAGNLEIECYIDKWKKYHFQCLIDTCSFDGCKKADLQIASEKDPDKPSTQMLKYVSLETYDQKPNDYKLGVNEEDVSTIREQIALSREHKTAYYIPIASKTRAVIECPKKCCIHGPSHSTSDDEEELQLYFQEYYYHPICLAQSAQVNVDGNEIVYYNSLTDDDKQLLDDLFKKDNDSYNFPKAENTSVDAEYCSYSKCSQLRTSIDHSVNSSTFAPIKGLRIRYQTKVYHPKCFNEMWVVNIDGHEIGNYNTLSKHWKDTLINLFEKWDDFDIPIIEIAKAGDYCNADECLLSKFPSKFPYPYTIKEDEICIKLHGGIFHAQCFQASGKSNLSLREFWNYQELSDKEKQFLERLFMQNDAVVDGRLDANDSYKRRSNAADSDIMDDDDDVTFIEPPSKKSRFTHQAEINNTSTTNQMEDKENVMEALVDDIKPIVKKEVNEPRVIHLTLPPTVSETNNDERGHGNDRAQSDVKQEIEPDTVPTNNETQATIPETNSNHQTHINITLKLEEPPAANMNSNLSTQNKNKETQEYDSDCVIIDDDESPPSSHPVSGNTVGSNNVSNASVGGRLGNNGSRNILKISTRVIGAGDSTAAKSSTTKSKSIKVEPKPQSVITKNAAAETPFNDDSVIEDSLELPHDIVSYQFKAPDDTFIQSTLKKLKIPFNRKAFNFWADVLYTVFSDSSTPATTHDISSVENSFFKCLSCFFTGKENNYISVKAGIQSYFYSSFKTFGSIDGIDFSKLDVTSDAFQKVYECSEITNVHFNFICSWLKCRIGIFSARHGLQKFGNWNESSHLILLMENSHDFYKPILTLS